MEFDDLAPPEGGPGGLTVTSSIIRMRRRWILRPVKAATGARASAKADDPWRVERSAGHLVAAAVRDGAVADVQHGVGVGAAVVDGGAVQGERRRADADAVGVRVVRRDRVAEHRARPPAQLAGEDRLAGGRADVQRHLRQADDVEALAEHQRDVDVLPAFVGVAHLRAVEHDGFDARHALAAVHLVAGVVGDGARQGQASIHRAAVQAHGAAVQSEGAGADADAVRVRVAGQHRIAEGELGAAGARRVARLADVRADSER